MRFRYLLMFGAGAVMFGLTFVHPAAAAYVSKFGPTDDVCVRSDYPDTPGQGSSIALNVGGPIDIVDPLNDYWRTYIKFDLSSFADDTIDSAKLFLTAHAFSRTGPNVPPKVSAYEILTDPYYWSEANMTWTIGARDLTMSGTPAHTETVDTTRIRGMLMWDVTIEAQNHKGGDFSLCLETDPQPSYGDWVQFYSKENSTPQDFDPYLRVLYRPPVDNSRLYGWEDFATLLGMFGSGEPPILGATVELPQPVFEGLRSLRLEDNSPTGTPQAYVAWVQGISDGDTVYAEFWRYDDTPDVSPSCRIWAHWNDSDVCTGYDGSAGGNEDYGPGEGWDLTGYTWVVTDGHTGIVIECRTYSDPGDVVWIDRLYVYVSNAEAIIHCPDAGPSAVLPTTWGGIKAEFQDR